MDKDKSKRDAALEFVGRLTKDAPPAGDIPKRFARMSIDHLFGDVWMGKDLEPAERSLLTCAMLVALNREYEMRIHFTGAHNLGVPRRKVEEMIIHAAHYAGWPVAVAGFRALNEVWPDEE